MKSVKDEVLQETFYSQRPFWELVHHEQEKLKKFKEDNAENPLEWSNRRL